MIYTCIDQHTLVHIYSLICRDWRLRILHLKIIIIIIDYHDRISFCIWKNVFYIYLDIVCSYQCMCKCFLRNVEFSSFLENSPCWFVAATRSRQPRLLFHPNSFWNPDVSLIFTNQLSSKITLLMIVKLYVLCGQYH